MYINLCKALVYNIYIVCIIYMYHDNKMYDIFHSNYVITSILLWPTLFVFVCLLYYTIFHFFLTRNILLLVDYSQCLNHSLWFEQSLWIETMGFGLHTILPSVKVTCVAPWRLKRNESGNLRLSPCVVY